MFSLKSPVFEDTTLYMRINFLKDLRVPVGLPEPINKSLNFHPNVLIMLVQFLEDQ